MKTRPFPWRCTTCDEVAVGPATIPSFSIPIGHDGHLYDVTVADLRSPRCTRCGEVMLDREATERLYLAMREAAGLLPPAAIRHGRESLGLSQSQMAESLGVAAETVDRWERGGQVQQRAMDLLLRAFFDVPEFREYLGCRGGAVASSWPVPETPIAAEVVASK